MKVPYKHLVKYIDSSPDIYELSEKLFQLGHEHKISNEIFDVEITPNRGDCLSLNGLLRDLNVFYNIKYKKEIYRGNLKPFEFKFLNKAKDSCKNISFLKVEIDAVPKKYQSYLEDYFSDLNLKKINFFTDVSNYLSYETGQPTHCYDSTLINQPITLDFLTKNCQFETLLDKQINIENGELVFFDKNNEVINLAGIIGGRKTACKPDTKSVIVECAHFDPETIIGKSVKYDINSDAAYKFERDTNPSQHDYVLERFLHIIESHCNINTAQLFKESQCQKEKKLIPFDADKLNKILGTNIDQNEFLTHLEKLGFKLTKNMIQVPSHRNDVTMMNDISEEVARAIGYDNIQNKSIEIIQNKSKVNLEEKRLKKLLIDNGFYEVINNPFVGEHSTESVKVDNPLDSNKKYLRTKLKDSLVKNLLFNERRQKDSIKLFEISDLYSNKDRFGKRVIGIIASGRIGKNYLDFSKKINFNYLKNILDNIETDTYRIEELSREYINSKSKSKIIYCEIQINSKLKVNGPYDDMHIKDVSSKKYIPVSEFPSSMRDLSFSITDFSKRKALEQFIKNFKHIYLKDVFMFDYFYNEKKEEIKIGYRFILQSNESTLTDKEVNDSIETIINFAKSEKGISIPGID